MAERQRTGREKRERKLGRERKSERRKRMKERAKGQKSEIDRERDRGR